MFKTTEEAETAVDKIWSEYSDSNKEDDMSLAIDLEHAAQEEQIRDLIPGEYDIEMPTTTGMGRRTEGTIIRTTSHDLRKIINEIVSGHIDGYPFPGTLADLAKFHGKCWGDGAVVDPDGWSRSVQQARKYSRASAQAPTKLFGKPIGESMLRGMIREAITLNLNKGDVILTGRFKNKRVVVKDIGKDKNGHPTVNGRSILRFKIEKLLPKGKWSKVSRNKREK